MSEFLLVQTASLQQCNKLYKSIPHPNWHIVSLGGVGTVFIVSCKGGSWIFLVHFSISVFIISN